MLARYGDVVPCRKLIDQLDIGHQTRSREDALQKVVAEQRILGNQSGERGLEEVHFVDALAAIRTFAKKVLIDVRDRAGVGVHSARIREDALKQRSLSIERQ